MTDIAVPTLPLGTYKHYKGNMYRVIGVGVDTESETPVVIYQPLYESSVQYWVRPYDMFVGDVMVDGILTARFTCMKEESDA